jgi:hypothetical protein
VSCAGPETNGREEIYVTKTIGATSNWCKSAALLSRRAWHFVNVPQTQFRKLQPSELGGVQLAFVSI